MADRRLTEWVLRGAVAMEFFGHGVLAFRGKPEWVPFVTFFGFSSEHAPQLMWAVGVLDITLALSVLVRPIRGALLWMTFWGFFTAVLRPLTGGSILEFIERGPNFGAPLALLLYLGHIRFRNNSPSIV